MVWVIGVVNIVGDGFNFRKVCENICVCHFNLRRECNRINSAINGGLRARSGEGWQIGGAR